MPSPLELIGLLAIVGVKPRLARPLRQGPARLNTLVDPDEVARHRSLACPSYDDCLDSAFRLRWPSFTCHRCDLFPMAGAFRTMEMMRQGGRHFADEEG
jgi:hypothetical protein